MTQVTVPTKTVLIRRRDGEALTDYVLRVMHYPTETEAPTVEELCKDNPTDRRQTVRHPHPEEGYYRGKDRG